MTPVPEPVRVLLVDDQPLIRAGLAAVLAASDDLVVVGEVDDGADVPEAVDRHHPDVVLMDVQMAHVDGLTATRRLLVRPSPPRVLVLTTFDLDEYVLGALRAGATGFVLKTAPPGELVAAVRSCAHGGMPLASSVVRRLVDGFADRSAAPAPPPWLARLTDRERDVLVAMAHGLSNAEVGERLHLAETTVKTHVTRVLAKLGVRDRLQAVVLAHRHHLV